MYSTGLTSSFKLTLMVVPGTMPRSEKTHGSWRSEPAHDSTSTFLSWRYWSTLMFSRVWIISRTSFTVIPTLTSSVMRSPSYRPKISMVSVTRSAVLEPASREFARRKKSQAEALKCVSLTTQSYILSYGVFASMKPRNQHDGHYMSFKQCCQRILQEDKSLAETFKCVSLTTMLCPLLLNVLH